MCLCTLFDMDWMVFKYSGAGAVLPFVRIPASKMELWSWLESKVLTLTQIFLEAKYRAHFFTQSSKEQYQSIISLHIAPIG